MPDAAQTGEQVSKVVLLFVAVAAFNNFRRGNLGEWAAAKFFNAAAPKPENWIGGIPIPGGGTGGDSDKWIGDIPLGVAGATDLVAVGSTRMSKRFAARWVPLAAAARADGVILEGGAYRSGAQQINLRRQHCGSSHYDIYEKPASQCSPPTARPGKSNHETGDAIDVSNCGRNSAAFKWLSRNAGRFGVYNLPSETWHWSIDGK